MVKLTKKEQQEIHEKFKEIMSREAEITESMQFSLHELGNTSYKDIPTPLFWFMMAHTSLTHIREQLKEDNFFEFMEQAANEINYKVKENTKSKGGH
jgi:type I restriction-modification system DNA methylase subunit|tara:strand:+ start:9 stop:299 length:291 start_codon:yes stop_codon:yes gene_type:complete